MKTIFLKFASAFFCGIFLASCAGPKISRYADEKPTLDLSEYFSGMIDAYGIFTDRGGAVKKRFTVLIRADWQIVDGRKVGTLDESFDYSDGTTQKRIWRLTEVSPGKYLGKADDVIGESLGDSAGNALNWTYTLALPVDGTTYHVQFDDWMYLITPKVMINKAKISKFGIELGEVTLSFTKDSASPKYTSRNHLAFGSSLSRRGRAHLGSAIEIMPIRPARQSAPRKTRRPRAESISG